MTKSTSDTESVRNRTPAVDQQSGVTTSTTNESPGYKRHFVKMVSLTMIPTLCLWSYTIYTLSERITDLNDIYEKVDSVLYSLEMGKTIHLLQKERDMSVLHGSALGSESKTFLLREYRNVDDNFEQLSHWPYSLSIDNRKWCRNKIAYLTHLNDNRRRLQSSVFDIKEEVKFYNTVIDVLLHALHLSIQKTKYAAIWKTLLAYQKITSSKEDVGLERAFGTYFFVHGNFPKREDFDYYNGKINSFKSAFGEAVRYSSHVQRLTDYNVKSSRDKNIVSVVNQFRRAILYHRDNDTNQVDKTIHSLTKAQYFFDNMTIYMDLLLKIQEDLGNIVIEDLNEKANEERSQVIVHSVLLFFVVLLCPIIVALIWSASVDVHKYSTALASKTTELKDMKTRSDSLLCQMLPKAIVNKLKKNSEVDAEYFNSVTIFFSDICSFGRISSSLEPEDVITLLNTLYVEIDELIDKYDVYKVETINDSYMVASGLPTRNGSRHGIEIARFAIEVIEVMKEKFQHKLQVRIGINTGPCMAGIVGSKMPRYCLFGDTINTASRMKSHSKPNRIQISSSTNNLLRKSHEFKISHRGSVDMKGKGEMKTFWLCGRITGGDIGGSISSVPTDIEELPGEITSQPIATSLVRPKLQAIVQGLTGNASKQGEDNDKQCQAEDRTSTPELSCEIQNGVQTDPLMQSAGQPIHDTSTINMMKSSEGVIDDGTMEKDELSAAIFCAVQHPVELRSAIEEVKIAQDTEENKQQSLVKVSTFMQSSTQTIPGETIGTTLPGQDKEDDETTAEDKMFHLPTHASRCATDRSNVINEEQAPKKSPSEDDAGLLPGNSDSAPPGSESLISGGSVFADTPDVRPRRRIPSITVSASSAD